MTEASGAVPTQVFAAPQPDGSFPLVLELHGSSGALILRNDNWKDDQRALIENTVFQPSDDRESVIVATLPPAAYTAILTGKNNTTGVALVDVFNLQ